MPNLSVVPPTHQQTPRASIKIERSSDSFRVRLRHPDDNQFFDLVENLKKSIDTEHREFDRERKCWVVDLAGSDALRAFAAAQTDAGATVSWATSDEEPRA